MNSEKVKSYVVDQPTILLLTSGYHLYREYLLRMVSLNANVWLFIDHKPEWELPYIVGYTTVDTLNVSSMVDAAISLFRDIKVDGVLCWDEIRMVHAAKFAQALNLPGGNPDSIGKCRDKHLTRTFLAIAGVPQATSILVSSLAEASTAAKSIGYPVILKPRALGASFGVSLVSEECQLSASYEHARTATEEGVPHYEEGVLVEEFMQGPEISIDSICVDGKLTPVFLARKLTGFFPHFEEIGHVINANDPLLQNPQLCDILERAHQAVDFSTGITHTELRLTESGPKIVEINARLGGDMIPYVGWVASGIDPGQLAVAVACGVQPRIEATQKRVAAIQFFYPESDSVVNSIHIDTSLLPASVEVAASLASPEQRLVLPPAGHVSCRYGYAIVHGKTAEDCMESIKIAERAFTLKATPKD